ncbi:dihydrodipicolinate synthase family protein [Mediterraneibacter agrestimuris]|uniref:dihydrodipicolinate synthase family protein n=1 Tax=Mediterraneibacter agrestimuris TaxID=2941333 RepID=UPI002040A923|nr:dihydrodipicolinate synthase family protein [Mediterraneibacter agrestimuris]
MNIDFIKGVIVPILTPVDKDEYIDEDKLRKHVDYVIDGGVLGILAFGSNGEFYALEEDEMERGLRIIIDQAAGRVPVYFGIGAISTKKCCRLAKMAQEKGASGISILQPMFLKPTEKELLLHFRTIAEFVQGLPVLLYNNPGRVGYGLSANIVECLAHEVKNIVGIKDTSGDITLTSEYIRRTRDINFKVFGGKDTLLYASMCHGAVGGVCTSANFMPELITDVYNKFVTGDLEGALEAQFKLNPVRISMDGASFPVAAKDMANLRGRKIGLPYKPNLPTPAGKALDNMVDSMRAAGLL